MLYKIKLILSNINNPDFYNYAKNALKNTPIWENNLITNRTIREIFVVISSKSFIEYEINLHKFIINETGDNKLIQNRGIFKQKYENQSYCSDEKSLNENINLILDNNEKLKLKIHKLTEDNKYLKKEVNEINSKTDSPSTSEKIKKTLKLIK